MIWFAGIFSVLFGAIYVVSPKRQKRDLKLVIFLLFVFLAIRFGQEADYFTYLGIYNSTTPSYKGFFLESYRHVVEPFYYLINIFAKKHELGFQFVLAFSAAITCVFNYLSIKEYSDRKLLSVFILLCNYIGYLTNLYRWAIAASIALYAILKYNDNNKLGQYLVFIAFASMFHTSAIVLLLIPVIVWLKVDFTGTARYAIAAIFCYIGSYFAFPLIIFVAGKINPRYYLYSTQIHNWNFLPCLVRLTFALFAMYYYRRYRNYISEKNKGLIRLYLLGSLIYFLLSSSMQAARISDYFTYLEIIIFPNIFMTIPANRRKKNAVFGALLLGFLVMFTKEIVTAEVQGNYISRNPLKYPYITIFNKEDIFDYRLNLKKFGVSITDLNYAHVEKIECQNIKC